MLVFLTKVFFFPLSLSLEFCRISANGAFYDKPLFTFRALGFFAFIFFLTICVYRDNVILAKHVVVYLCKKLAGISDREQVESSQAMGD